MLPNTTRIGDELLPNKISRETAKESALLVRSNLLATPPPTTYSPKKASKLDPSQLWFPVYTPFKARSIPAFNSLSSTIPYRWQLAGGWRRRPRPSIERCLLLLAIAVALSLRNRSKKAKANRYRTSANSCVCVSIAYIHPWSSKAIGSGV